MSLMKWFIISTIVSLPLMFLLPPDNQSLNDPGAEKILASLQFNDACGLALHNCTMDTAKTVYAQCTKLYGNITLDQCKTKCCAVNETMADSDFLNIVTSVTS